MCGDGGCRALVSPDGVAPSRMVSVSASANLPLHHKVQKFASGTGSPGWSRKKGHKTDVVWWWWYEICCTWLAENTGCNKSTKIHHLCTITQLCRALSSQLRHVSTIRNKSSAVAEIGDRGHNRHGPKRGGAAMPLSRKLGPRLIQCGLDQGPLHAKCHLDPSSQILPQ